MKNPDLGVEHRLGTRGGMALNGGPAGRAGWRAVFPIEKHEFSAGCTEGRAKTDGAGELHIRAGPYNRVNRRAALKGGPAVCTTERDGGLHNRARRRAALKSGLHKTGRGGCTTERAGGLHNRTDCTTARAGGLHINTFPRAAQQGRLVDKTLGDVNFLLS